MRWNVTTIALGAMVLGMALLPLGLLAHAWFGEPSLSARPELVWGERGIAAGHFMKPRAMTIDNQDRIYIVDMTARIQVFDRDGNWLRGWRTPLWEHGKPTGLSIDPQGNLRVADTHYYRVLSYTPQGDLLEPQTVGGVMGSGPGEFGFVTDAAFDSQGSLYVAEYGENDRIQKFDRQGQYLFCWGGHGSQVGQFRRPQSLAVDSQDRVWVADACNHRIQVFDATGSTADLIFHFGQEGMAPGEFRYPYGILLDEYEPAGGCVYICEFGNHRVQKFTLSGQHLATWGQSGREPGQLHGPWAIVKDSQGRLHVLDTYNHRVQRVRF